ncbi:gram-negative porin family protein [Paraburkholderia xenovorans LB400]|uniref:Outer membrane porin, OmpC family n=1 Tax=Paraburkholderia xenovorans (strain LB400) TaxID=266265 RepID=Q13GN2_PARXL|nr:porin [Paraburkholderia xenovorans]ABE36757.1 outer membrane porin, OmpC family [Paraburkholderia xenovorans LB400]AIP35066.1 gram-negative porin family protein [Paraburkholderia xenovorans LB400]
MRKQFVTAVPLLCSALACHAQSSVTLYGTLDTGITYTNNQGGGASWQENSGSRGASKWGIKGAEDLGNQYKAIFDLEGAISSATGAMLGSREFGRYAYVGLTGPLGTLTVGRQYDLAIDYAQGLTDALRFSGALATHAGDVDNLWGTYELDNDIKYTTPTIHGFTASTMISVGGVAGDTSRNSAYEFGAGYVGGPLKLGATYLNLRDPAISLYGAATVPATGGTFANPITNPIFSGYVSANRMQVASIGGLYTIGASTLGAQYSLTLFDDMVHTAATPNVGSARFANAEVSYMYQFTPFADAGISYDYTEASSAHYSQINFGAQYNLSKATFLYFITAWEHASGENSLGKPAVAAISTLSASTTANQLAMRVGIRHSF